MSVALPEFYPEFKKHHGIYVMRKTFEGTCAFLTGYEAGSGTSYLRDFHSWLVRRDGGRSELYWPYLVLGSIYPDRSWPDIRYLTEEQDSQVVGVLFDLLDSYFATLE